MGRLATDTPAGVYNSGNALFFGSKIQIQKFLGTPWGPQVPKFSVYSALNEVSGRCDSFKRSNPALRAPAKDPKKSPKNQFF